MDKISNDSGSRPRLRRKNLRKWTRFQMIVAQPPSAVLDSAFSQMPVKIHAADLTILERFVSGHNFSCAEKSLFIWASAPETAIQTIGVDLYQINANFTSEQDYLVMSKLFEDLLYLRPELLFHTRVCH